MSLLEAALNYSRRGYAVFPCRPDAKVPATAHGLKDATTDPEQIRQWWTDCPTYNVGLATAGLLVVDRDPLPDGSPNPWPASLEQAGELYRAPTQLTPRRGSHHVYRQPAGKDWKNSAGKLALGVDTRAAGGYIVVTPSIVAGSLYKWQTPLGPLDTLPEPPPWLVDALDALARPKPAPNNGTPRQPGVNAHPKYIQTALDSELGRVAMSRDGSRNDTLNKASFNLGQFVGAGALDRATVEELLADAAAKCGLPGDEAARTIRSGIDAGVSQPRKLPEGRRHNAKPGPNGQPSANGKHEPAAAADEPRTATEIILDYFRQRYQPVFLRSGIVHCANGDEVSQRDALCPDSGVLAALASASNAPRVPEKFGGGVNEDALPALFRKWSCVAWGDLLRELPDEVNARLGADAPARETFVRLVREALMTQVTFGDVIGRQGVTQVERRSLIGWADKFAKAGPWRDVRSLACWCRETSPTQLTATRQRPKSAPPGSGPRPLPPPVGAASWLGFDAHEKSGGANRRSWNLAARRR
jgi:hypothetical protein